MNLCTCDNEQRDSGVGTGVNVRMMSETLEKKIIVSTEVRTRDLTLTNCRSKNVFIITDKVKPRRGGGKRCRCYERRRGKS